MTTRKAPEVDMSAEAIERRLEQVRALYKLMVSLRSARLAGEKKDAQ